MKFSGIKKEGNGVEWGAPVVLNDVEKCVVVGVNGELDVPVVAGVVVSADIVVVVLGHSSTDPAETDGAETLAIVVVAVPMVVIGTDMVVYFCIYNLNFSSD